MAIYASSKDFTIHTINDLVNNFGYVSDRGRPKLEISLKGETFILLDKDFVKRNHSNDELIKNMIGYITPYIGNEIEYHMNNHIIPLSSQIAEECFYFSFVKSGICDKNIKWNINSHSSGGDVGMHYPTFSVKGNKIIKNSFSISFNRTTKYKSIQEKIRFFKNEMIQHGNIILFLRNELESHTEIMVLYINANKCKELSFDNYNISETFSRTSTSSGWKTDKINSCYLEITKATSDQIWFHCQDYKQFIDNNKNNTIILFNKTFQNNKIGKSRYQSYDQK